MRWPRIRYNYGSLANALVFVDEFRKEKGRSRLVIQTEHVPHSGRTDMAHKDTLAVYESLQPGDRIELQHEVKVGFRKWQTTTRGSVLRLERRRHSLHYQRNFDDKVFSDLIVLKRENGEMTTVTLDEFTVLRKLA